MQNKRVKSPEQALKSLMTMCAKSEKSSGDALRLMTQWGVEGDHRREILSKLIEEKFIDDNRYASAYVREKSRLYGWGYYKIKSKLQEKGVATEIINTNLQTLNSDESNDRLQELINKRVKNINENDLYKLKGKLVRYALGMGYDYDSVISTIEKTLNNNEDSI